MKSWIQFAAENHVTLQLPVEHYVNELDLLVKNSIANGDVTGLKGSVGVSLKTIAVMDCDWNDGADRFETARKFMGEEILNNMKLLYPDKYERLRNGCK